MIPSQLSQVKFASRGSEIRYNKDLGNELLRLKILKKLEQGPATIRLDPKDQPILLAAIHGKADCLLTGDARHFEHLYGKRIEGVLVLRPATYFERRRRI